MPKRSAVILLSGGLDSLVSLAAALNEHNSVSDNKNPAESFDIKLALTFDYGQRAAEDEITAAAEICKYYNIKHKVITLPFLGEISTSALNLKDANLVFDVIGENSARAVWVPNRNGLFLNIAASFSDAFNFDAIIIGANKEEAETFPDNSKEFCRLSEEVFKFSTKSHPKVYAPLANLKKHEIIDYAIKLNVNLKLLKSCYNGKKDRLNNGKSHCGLCESCKRLKNAILKSSNKDLIKLFF